MIRERQNFLVKQENWGQNSEVIGALFTNIRKRMKNKQATIVGRNAKKKSNLSLIPESDESYFSDEDSR